MAHTSPLTFLKPALVASVALLLSLGCAMQRANKAFDQGRFDEAVQEYQGILKNSPNHVKAKMGYRRAAARAAEVHLEKAREAEKRGQSDVVYLEVRRAAVLDPSNAVATDWIANLELAAQRKKVQEEAEDNLEIQRAKADAQPAVPLNPRSLEGMDLNYSRRTALRDIFAALSKNSGVNIILHSTFPQDAAATVDLRGLTFQRILDTLMIQNDLFYRVIDSNTILVLKDGQQQRDKFENQLVKTFYLSNAEAENVRGVLQMLVPQIKTFVDKRLNALVMRGNPQQITTATRVVNQLDKAKAEVMVYMELMEVTQNSLEQVGLLPVLGAADTQGVYRLGATLDNTGAPNQNKGGIRIQRSDIRYLFPSLALDALKSSGDAKLVASPNVRVLSGVKGEVNIGEQVSTTQSSIGVPGMTGTTGVSAGMASSYLAGASQTQYAYQDVGVKINVTPSVHFNGDISLKIEAEIKTLKSGSTPGRPDMGQRIIKTEARAKDGETIVFAGMLKEDERKSLQGIWGLSDIPLLGKLIGSNRYERAKTDVLLTFRAVVVRKPDLQFEDLSAFDPDFATSQSGPFAPKASTKMETPKNVGTSKAEPTKETPKGEAKPLDPKPGAEATKPPAGEGVPTEMKTDAKSEAKTEPQAEPAQGQLVLFLAPIAAPLAKGQQVELNLLVSNGRGLSSGNLELRIDPKLKLVSAAAGDFLTQEGGSIQQAPLKDGILKLAFTRSGTASDSGSLVTLILEGLAPGNAPVLVQSGSYMVGKNPIAALVHNALITVE